MTKGGINQRIGLEGDDELLKKLNDIAGTGGRVGQSVRDAFRNANPGLQQFTETAGVGAVSAKQMHFALQNLTFQVNDVATSLASGISPMRTFAQQGGQIFQAFQQAGGVSAVLSKVGTAVSDLVTPMRLAALGAAALVVGIAAVAVEAANMSAAANRFDVILKGMGKSSQATGQSLEDAALRLREVGLSGTEAGKGLTAALREGIRPQDAEKVVRIGNDLNAVLGEGSMEQFIKAAASGGEPLRQFAERLGVIPKGAFQAADALNEVTLSVSKETKAINDALEKRGRSVADEQRRLAQEIGDLHRKKGTPEEEAALQSQRRLVEINRQTARQINEIIKQRNEDNRKQLDEFNKKIAKDAQAAADASIVDLIGQRVKGLALENLTPMHRALLDLRIAWDNFMTSLAKSQAIALVVKAMSGLFTAVTKLLSTGGGIPALGIAVALFIPILVKLALAIKGLVLATGPWGIAIGLVATAILLIVENWDTVKKGLADAGTFMNRLFIGFAQAIAGPLNAAGALVTGFVQSIKDGFTAAGQWVSDVVSSIGIAFVNAFNGTLAFFTTWIGKIGDGWTASKQFVTGWADFLIQKATEAISFVEGQINGLVDWFKGGFQAIQDAFSAVSDWINGKINEWIGWFGNLLAKASAVAAAISSALGGSSALDQAAGGGATLNAARGGRVLGAGSATSDSILAWLSNGEFIVNAFATKRFLPLLQAINKGFTPRMAAGGRVARSPIPELALGGFAISGPRMFGQDLGALAHARPTRAFSLTIGEHTFKDLTAPEKEAQRIIQVAKQKLGRRIGTKPGWYGGR